MYKADIIQGVQNHYTLQQQERSFMCVVAEEQESLKEILLKQEI